MTQIRCAWYREGDGELDRNTEYTTLNQVLETHFFFPCLTQGSNSCLLRLLHCAGFLITSATWEALVQKSCPKPYTPDSKQMISLKAASCLRAFTLQVSVLSACHPHPCPPSCPPQTFLHDPTHLLPSSELNNCTIWSCVLPPGPLPCFFIVFVALVTTENCFLCL